MTLASTLSECRCEMICDLAETYHIYDYKRVPGRLLGTLVAGLGVNSRVSQKLAGLEAPMDTVLTALLVDEVRNVTRMLGGVKDKEKPLSERFFTNSAPVREELTFKTGADFERERARLLGVINGNGSR